MNCHEDMMSLLFKQTYFTCMIIFSRKEYTRKTIEMFTAYANFL